MGTRSLTVFVDDEKKEIAVMYRQYDGYPEGHGQELCDILKNRRLVNGYSSIDAQQKAFNGMHCLAAQIVADMKDGIGDIYLDPAGTRDCGEEYIYVVEPGEAFDEYEDGRMNLYPKVTMIEVGYNEPNKETVILENGICLLPIKKEENAT